MFLHAIQSMHHSPETNNTVHTCWQRGKSSLHTPIQFNCWAREVLITRPWLERSVLQRFSLHAPRAHIHNRLWRARAAALCGNLWEYGLYIINPKSQSRIGLQWRFVVYSHSLLILHPNQIISSTHITSAIVIMWWFRVPSTTMTTKNI